MTRPTTLLVLGVLTTACGGGAVPAKVTLRYRPPAGATHEYDLDETVKITMEAGPLGRTGEQRITVRMHFTQSVTGPVADGVEVKLLFDSVNVDMPGVSPEVVAQEFGQVHGLVTTVVFDERGHEVRSDLATAPGVSLRLASQIEGGVRAMAFPLPEQPVGPGDSWTITTELPLSQVPEVQGSSAVRSTLTVKEIRVAGNDTTVLLTIVTALPRDPISLRLAGQAAMVHLTGSLEGEQVFSLSRGVIVNGAVKGTMKMSLTSPILGSRTMTVNSATETSLRLADNR